jgi:hypothetical protein
MHDEACNDHFPGKAGVIAGTTGCQIVQFAIGSKMLDNGLLLAAIQK